MQSLLRTFMQERKFKAVARVYERVVSLIDNDQPEFDGRHSNPGNKL